MQRRAGPQGTRAASMLGPNDVLLTGGLAVDSPDGMQVERATNSIFAIGPGGKVIGRYDKAHLVPYGEYLPMRPMLSAIGLSRLAPGDSISAGPGPRTLDLGAVRPCRRPDLLRDHLLGPGRRRGAPAGFIFNPSNDAWFGAWGPPQHLAQARLRAIEEGLPIIRATPNGHLRGDRRRRQGRQSLAAGGPPA